MLIIKALLRVLGPHGAGDSRVFLPLFNRKPLCKSKTAVKPRVEGGPEFLVVGARIFSTRPRSSSKTIYLPSQFKLTQIIQWKFPKGLNYLICSTPLHLSHVEDFHFNLHD